MKRYTDATLTADVRKSRRRGSFVTRGEFDPGAFGGGAVGRRGTGALCRRVAGLPPRMKGKLAAAGRAVNETAAAMPRAAAPA